MGHLDGLDPDQLAAATAPPVPLKIVAGAGSGKTRTLVSRIVFQVETGVAEPEKMFIAAFTRAAADEMQERIATIMHDDVVQVGTFHSLMFRFINQEQERDGLERYGILKESYRTSLIKDLLGKPSRDYPEAVNIDADVANVGGIISRWKNHLIAYDSVEVAETLQDAPENSDLYAAATIYPLYESRNSMGNLIDFDDMLLKAYQRLSTNPASLERARAQWTSFFSDEHQDTNVSQWEILKLLAPAKSNPNVTVVGDYRQALYRFRGATPELMDAFDKFYKGALNVDLRLNYRSTGEIVSYANEIARKFNVAWQVPARPPGTPPVLVRFKNRYEQASEIARYVSEQRSAGVRGGDIAILVRTNGQTAEIESAFVSAGLPYWCQGGGFFDRMEIGDVLAYLKLAVDHTSATDLARIINKPTRYLGRVYVEQVEKNAGRFKGDLVTAMRHTTRYNGKSLFQKQLQSAQKLADLIERITPNMSASHAIDLVLSETDYMNWLRVTSGTSSGADDSREENLAVLKSHANEHGSVDNLLRFTAQASALQRQTNDATEISTVHRAKGREWDTVICSNFDDGSIPHKAAINAHSEQALDDERRIAYVALTRAKETLIVTGSDMDSFGNPSGPSSFLVEANLSIENADLNTDWWDYC